MKKFVIITLMLLSTKILFAQDFKPSSNFVLTLKNTLLESNEQSAMATLQTNTSQPQEVATFPLVNGSKISEIHISTLETPLLQGVRRVLKVDVSYVQFCTYTISNYVLETLTGNYITLPSLTNEDCGDAMALLVYLFPSQKYGEENQIITSQITTDANSIINVSYEDRFIWNDDTYGTSGQLYQDF